MMNPVTIVHLTASPCYGGPERQMLELGRELADFRSVFVSFEEEGRCHEFIREAENQGFASHCLKHDTPRLLAAARELKALLNNENAGLLCCNGYKADLLGLIVARQIGLPVISISRGWTGESFRVRLFEALDRRVLRRMDKVVCVSHAQAKKVRRAGVAVEKIAVIQDAVRPERFDAPDPSYRERLCEMFPEPPKIIVGAAGRLSPEKGYDLLIDAAARIINDPDIRKSVGFVLFGEGRLKEMLSRRIEMHGLQDRFLLGGFHADLDRYIPHFDLLVQSSHTEGLPNIVLEACAAGVAVVATDVGGTSEIIDDGLDGYLVPPNDSEMLARRIADILSDDSLRREMGQRISIKVRNRFSFAAQREAFVKLFSELNPEVFADCVRHKQPAYTGAGT